MRGDDILKIAQRNPDVEVEGLDERPDTKPIRVMSRLEEKFLSIWKQMNGPDLTPEYRFDPKRKWRMDFAHIPTQTAIELEGGIWGYGRHNRAPGFVADCDKYNSATFAGWSVFRLATGMVTTESVGQIIRFVQERSNEQHE